MRLRLRQSAVPEPVYTDTHAHLSYVLERQGRGVLDSVLQSYAGSDALILDPGVDADDFPARIKLLGAFPFVRLAAGIWPDCRAYPDVDTAMAILEPHARDASCVAVGECGLDYHWMHGSETEQEALFRAQAQLAVELGKPILVHSRDAYLDTLRVVRDYAERIPVIIHCFGYGPDEAKAFVEAGCYISFAGNLSYKKNLALREACQVVPDTRLLLETDSPYMNPEPYRGKPSSPFDIARTYDCAGHLRACAPITLASLVTQNARLLFGA